MYCTSTQKFSKFIVCILLLLLVSRYSFCQTNRYDDDFYDNLKEALEKPEEVKSLSLDIKKKDGIIDLTVFTKVENIMLYVRNNAFFPKGMQSLNGLKSVMFFADNDPRNWTQLLCGIECDKFTLAFARISPQVADTLKECIKANEVKIIPKSKKLTKKETHKNSLKEALLTPDIVTSLFIIGNKRKGSMDLSNIHKLKNLVDFSYFDWNEKLIVDFTGVALPPSLKSMSIYAMNKGLTANQLENVESLFIVVSPIKGIPDYLTDDLTHLKSLTLSKCSLDMNDISKLQSMYPNADIKITGNSSVVIQEVSEDE